MEFVWVLLLVLICVVVGILCHRRLRPLFPVWVNCWFCNHDTRVPYGNKNCWDCPNCEQYNGFTNDGDYNKPVPAQYTENINHPIKCEPSEFLSRPQYLCQNCQRNQLLKIKQLANFEPLNEATYDDEMAFYKRHLESVYALCLSCDTKVKRELDRLEESLDRPKESPTPVANTVTELENTTAVRRTIQVMPVIVHLSVYMTRICAVLLLSIYFVHCLPHTFMPWIMKESVEHVDELIVCLCGLFICMVTKLLHGKHRLHLEDSVHVLMWLAVMLVCLFCGPTDFIHGKLCLIVGLVGLEIELAFKQRQASNVTSPIMKRLSLDGSPTSTNFDAASEAVSSVSTSGRRQTEPFRAPGNEVMVSTPNASDYNKKKISTNSRTEGLPEYPTLPNTRDREISNIRKNLGDFFITQRSSESGYSTGRSSPFCQNSFGMTSEPGLSGGSPFPRPLIFQARLNVVSFKPSSVSGSTTYMNRPSSPTGLFSGMPYNQQSSGGNGNLFLTQKESRPQSMFLTKTAENTTTSTYKNNYTSTSEYRGLFSQWNNSKALFAGRASSEVGFPPQSLKSNGAPSATWWRSSATDIVDDKDDGWLAKDNGIVLDGPKTPKNIVTTECDSTTPQLCKLHVSGGMKKRKSKKTPKPTQCEGLWSSYEEDKWLHSSNQSLAPTMVLQPKQGWTWWQWLAVGVAMFSVSTNLFLAWTVWSFLKS